MTANVDGRSIELFFIEGKPDGMLTAEVFNWTGHVLITPRTRIGAAFARKEARYTGVYILLGEQDGESIAYIGEGEDISDRIRSHDTNKDWWTTAVLVTTADNKLNKAHVKYLEARLVEEARDAKRVTLDNASTPTRSGLTEAAQSNMESFLSYLFMVLPAVRVDVFIRNTRPTVTESPVPQDTVVGPQFLMNLSNLDITARAVLKDGEFIVQSGSQARQQWVGHATQESGYARLHSELKATGILKEDGPRCVFTQNYAFSSASAAAAVIYGTFVSGPQTWKLEDGRTYRDWEAAQLSRAAAQS